MHVQVPPNYDSLLGKLIVWAEDRPAAINRMRRALNELVISGVPTTIQYHTMILDLEDFQKGNVDTGFIPSHAEELKEPPPSPKAVGVIPCCYPSCSFSKCGYFRKHPQCNVSCLQYLQSCMSLWRSHACCVLGDNPKHGLIEQSWRHLACLLQRRQHIINWWCQKIVL